MHIAILNNQLTGTLNNKYKNYKKTTNVTRKEKTKLSVSLTGNGTGPNTQYC